MAKCKFCGAEVTIGGRDVPIVAVRRRAGTILEEKRNRLLPLMLSMMIWVQVVRFLEVNIT